MVSPRLYIILGVATSDVSSLVKKITVLRFPIISSAISNVANMITGANTGSYNLFTDSRCP